MPDTQITVSRSADRIALRIRVPAADLRLALPQPTPRDAGQLIAKHRALLLRYFTAHMRLVKRGNQSVPIRFESIRIHADHDHHVGQFAQIEFRGSARVAATTQLRLNYDAILHRVANHRARVTDATGRPIGTIRYSLATKRANPLPLP